MFPIMNVEYIGRILRERRQFLNLKQEDLAEISGVAIKTIYAVELGKGNPSILTLMKILKVLGMEMIVQTKKS
jgi:transcriptional regulator with XRE-family HTH domain